jgi:hypothetical protein
MFHRDDVIEDPSNDDIGQLMNVIRQMPTWTKVKQGLFDDLVELLKKKKYIQFEGDFREYHLTRVGESCLFNVPINRRGHLSIFRGKTIRLVCVSSGKYAARSLMAAIYP